MTMGAIDAAAHFPRQEGQHKRPTVSHWCQEETGIQHYRKGNGNAMMQGAVGTAAGRNLSGSLC